MIVVLIPAYQPDARLPGLVAALHAADPARPVLVVDDGSGPRYRDVFQQAEDAGCRVVRIGRNQGKGFALRVGIRTVMRDHPGADVVTADSDGQHAPADVERVAAALEAGSGSAIVLGTREFAGAVPPRSRLGNRVTRVAFRLVSGTDVRDTQTGLRGLPAASLPWLLTVAGDRFDYEFRVLLQARATGLSLTEVPIATVYADGNRSSHFRPLVDSMRVCAPLARFAASALLSFGIDTIALLVLQRATGMLLLSVVGARALSASVNFAINRSYVFRRGRDVPMRTAAARYLSLAALLLAASYGTLTALTDAGAPLLAAKIATEAVLFAVSFAVQRAVVFAPVTPSAGASRESPPCRAGARDDDDVRSAAETPRREAHARRELAASDPLR